MKSVNITENFGPLQIGDSSIT